MLRRVQAWDVTMIEILTRGFVRRLLALAACAVSLLPARPT